MSDDRRFGGIERLFGHAGALRIRQAHVAVVGLGGVGSWAAESLALLVVVLDLVRLFYLVLASRLVYFVYSGLVCRLSFGLVCRLSYRLSYLFSCLYFRWHLFLF